LADGDGQVTSRYNYDAYGTTLGTSTSEPDTSLLYCGEQFDSTLGMYNLRARFYDPSNGRFTARDTFQGFNEDPQSLHKYAYCHQEPVNGIDPTGESLIQQIATMSLQFTTFTMRWWPAIKIGFALWDAVTIARIAYKYFTGEEVTAVDWVQFGLASVGLLLGPGTKAAAKVIMSAKFGLTVNSSLRTFEGARRAISAFVHVDEVAKVAVAPGLFQTGGFFVDHLGNPVIQFVRHADEFRTAKTLVHEFLHYWHRRMAGRPVGEAYKSWAAAAKAFEESTYAQFQLADGTKGFYSQLTEIIMTLTK
jgi:RHS repeat-associated protein